MKGKNMNDAIKTKRQFNEKPSKYGNIGNDILGAKRHNFDTYENETQKMQALKEKTKKKNWTKTRKEIIEQIESGNNVRDNLLEFSRIQAMQCEEFAKLFNYVEFSQSEKPYEYLSKVTMKTVENRLTEIKAFKHDAELYRNLYENWNKARKAFNKLIRLVYRIEKLDYSSEKCIEKALNLLGKKPKKDQFIELNGAKGSWKLEKPFNMQSIEYLKTKGISVQFGNSLGLSEREYCIENLASSIKQLESILSFDFSSVNYAFASRGKRGSIAHYENRNKVLAFNRQWSGAFLHEIGHAIDYSLGMVSLNIPRHFFDDYAEQLTKNEVKNKSYYLKNTEFFARAFEVYIVDGLGRENVTLFTQNTRDRKVMPELTLELRGLMKALLATLLKK